MGDTNISVVIPLYNEEANLDILYNKLKPVLVSLNKNHEVIFIDDGSTDSSFKILCDLYRKDKNIKIIKFRRNFGQTAALDAGFKYAKGGIIITMDADLQNDPADIPRLIEKMKEGYDVVSGWRYKRKDPLSKSIPSRIAGWFRKILTNEKIHDSGCSLKSYRRECFENLDLYGEMHRFIPTLLRWRGFKIAEVKVRHNPRIHGTTKYGYGRIFGGFLDLLTAKFWEDYSTRPLQFFAKLGGIHFLIGFLIVSEKIFIELLYLHKPLNITPLLLAAVLFIIMGVLFIGFGFLAEIQVKSYYAQNKQSKYFIEKVVE